MLRFFDFYVYEKSSLDTESETSTFVDVPYCLY